MAIRANHYDAAFEDLLRHYRVPYVAVDERRRALCAEGSLKSMDFIVDGGPRGRWLVDVKGRRHTGRLTGGWENWATADDIESLLGWEKVFGPGFRAMLVFAYDHAPQAAELPVDGYAYRNRLYSFHGVWVGDYAQHLRVRSPAWDTVWAPAEAFRALRFPLSPLFAAT